MLSAEDITGLLRFRDSASGVLSVYLPLEKERQPVHDLELLLKGVKCSDADRAKALEQAAVARPEGAQSLALFSAQAHGLWAAAWLPQPAGPLARVDASPQLSALLNAADQYQRYVVALVDENRARFLEVFMGESLELPDGGERQPSAQTRQAWLRWTAERLLRLGRQRRPGRFILGASPDLASALTSHCHTSIQDNLILDPTLGPDVTLKTTAARVHASELDSRAVRESVLTHRLLDAARAGMGVVGLHETLTALQNNQVRLMLVRDGLARIGRRCGACGHMALSGKKCDGCGGATVAVFNVVAEMAQLALDQGCEVFRVLRDRRLESAGGIGAELRFPVSRTPSGAAHPTSKVV
jgi:hypothetical protein